MDGLVAHVILGGLPDVVVADPAHGVVGPQRIVAIPFSQLLEVELPHSISRWHFSLDLECKGARKGRVIGTLPALGNGLVSIEQVLLHVHILHLDLLELVDVNHILILVFDFEVLMGHEDTLPASHDLLCIRQLCPLKANLLDQMVRVAREDVLDRNRELAAQLLETFGNG